MVRVSRHPGPGAATQRSTTVITLDRPHRRNALDMATLQELRDAFGTAVTEGVRCVVLTGAPPAFSAGADLDDAGHEEFVELMSTLLVEITELPIPVIAAIDGPALGAGMQLVAACDLRVATPGSTFGVPAARLGLALDRWTVHRLAAELTAPVARAMLLAAETFDAERLFAVGAVHRLGDLGTALEWADDIVRLAPLTIAAHKLALEHADQPVPADAAVESARMAAWASEDAAEGRAAFLAKRRPDFSGR